MPYPFAITIFVGASLLFWVEPMVAKMILPRLGGTPAVWNVCLVFFQTVLLAGYAYVHIATTRLGIKRQAWLQVILVLVPFAVLPLGLRDWNPPTATNPTGWLCLWLAVSVGLPFFTLATTAPLLQKWYVLGSDRQRDPYVLYAASNLGSLLALLGYPILLEPWLPLTKSQGFVSQVGAWSIGYGLYSTLLFCCMYVVYSRRTAATPESRDQQPARPEPITRGSNKKASKDSNSAALPAALDRISSRTALRWIFLAFVPSSLLLGMTTFLTQDIAAIPLLWVLPLSLYLLSFIVVFAYWPAWCQTTAAVAMPVFILATAFVDESGLDLGILVSILLHLMTLLAVSLTCHGEHSRTRPREANLTQFYLLIALGGVLGGLFNALLAPIIFSSVLEHKLVLVLSCLLLPESSPPAPLYLERRLGLPPSSRRRLILNVLIAIVVGALCLDLLVFYTSAGAANSPPLPGVFAGLQSLFASIASRFNLQVIDVWKVFLYGIPLAICLSFIRRPTRLALGFAAFLIACQLTGTVQEQGHEVATVVHRERSFFSVLTVDVEAAGTPAESHVLTHGTTLHGQQFMHPALRQEPLTYYSKSGPVGQLMSFVDSHEPRKTVALIGLGAGATACYGRPGDSLVCYEIDSAVVRIARDPKYFTYLTDCAARGCKVETILGDARLRLQEARNHEFDVIVVDAFSSDAVPVHLLTRQAFELYMQKLKPDGYLLIHVSNRYLGLDPVVGNIARSLELNAFRQHDDVIDLPGKWQSDWTLVTREKSPGPKWEPIPPDNKVGVWTDDYSNLWRVFRVR